MTHKKRPALGVARPPTSAGVAPQVTRGVAGAGRRVRFTEDQLLRMERDYQFAVYVSSYGLPWKKDS